MTTDADIRYREMQAAVDDLCGVCDALHRAWLGDPAESVGAHNVSTLERIAQMRDDAERMLVRATSLLQDLEG